MSRPQKSRGQQSTCILDIFIQDEYICSGDGMKKAILKRTADALEKLAIAAFVMALFDSKAYGIIIGAVCLTASYIFTAWEARQ